MIDLKYSEILINNKKLKEDSNSGGTPYSISLLSNITINPLIGIIEYISRINNINPIIKVGNYDNLVQDSSIHQNSNLVIIFYDIYKIVDGLPFYFEDISADFYSKLRERIYKELDIIMKNLQNTPSVIINTFSSHCFITNYSITSRLDTFVSELTSDRLDSSSSSN